MFENNSDIKLNVNKGAKYYINYESEPLSYKEFIEWCEYNDYNPVDFLEEQDYLHKSSWRRTGNTSGIDININTNDILYSDSNMAKVLETLGTYILAKDKRDENDELKEKVYNSRELFLRACQEENFINNAKEMNNFAVFKENDNYKKAPKTTITKSDYEKYPILKEYMATYNEFKKMYKDMSLKDRSLNEEEKRIKYYIRNNLASLKKDIIDVKLAYEKPIKWKQPLKDEGAADWDYLDLMDKEHVKCLLQVHAGDDFQNDKACIIADLCKLINQTDFTDRQKEVLDLWMSDLPIMGDKGKGARGISEILEVTPSTVSRTLDKAIDKIIKTYEEELEDWYYLNIAKGIYKKCTGCGKIKLVQRFNKNGKKGYKSKCKICSKL